MTPSLRIAVADDEPDMRDYFRKLLPRLGHQLVAVAENGKELIDLCRQHHPDLIITDAKMPELDGDIAVQKICAECPTPFILVSAYNKPDSLTGQATCCRWSYLMKPVRRDDLEEAIADVMAEN